MPFGQRPACSACRATVTLMWRKDELGSVMCNSCYINHLNLVTKDDSCSIISDSDSIHSGSNSGIRLATLSSRQSDVSNQPSKEVMSSSNVRKSMRIKPKSKAHQYKTNSGKGKNKKSVPKKPTPVRAHPSVATVVTCDALFYQGFYYQVGDIVSLVDHSGDIYYAQIQGLLQDQYCEKSAILTWLLPTTASDPDKFEPSTYFLGPTEELPRKLECMEFVCHAPADYYKPKYVSIPTLHREQQSTGFIWTNIGPKACKVPTTDEIFGINMNIPASLAGEMTSMISSH